MAKTKLTGRKRDERITAYAFTAPAVILLIAFLVVPMIYTVYYSGFKYQIMRPDAIKMIGIENYQKLFQDKNFWMALKNTVYFTVVVVPVQCILALGLALLVSKKFRGVAIFRTMYFSPQLTSMVVISVLWSVLYNANPSTGLINSLLVSLGMDPINFLSNEHTAMNSIIFMSAWQGAGYQMMIFLAGLQAIPGDQYEAASIDGAGRWAKIKYVTLPGIKPTIMILLLMNVGNVLNAGFEIQYLLGNGLVQKVSQTIDIYVLKWGISQGDYSIGTAAGIFKSAVSIILIVIANQIAKRNGEERLFYCLLYTSPSPRDTR